jgi:hypothetical protein
VELAVTAPVDAWPLVARRPLQALDAWQLVAFVADQLNVALSPLLTALGPTLSVTTGRGALIDTVADCAALPPGPVQVNV